MEQQHIEELKTELAALEGSVSEPAPAQSNGGLGIEEIPDNDPEVQKIVNTKCHDPENCSGRLHLLFGPLPLQKAKERVVLVRRIVALKTKAAEQNSPVEATNIAQQLEAAKQRWNEWVRRTLHQLGLPSV
jgi:hypothetical protein